MQNRNYSEERDLKVVRAEGLEPPCLAAPDPKSGMSTNFTTPAVRRDANVRFCIKMWPFDIENC